MKTDDIRHQLESYRQGQLTPDEVEQLNRATHRDEVMDAASRGAASVRRHRFAKTAALAAVVTAIAATTLWHLVPSPHNNAPMTTRLAPEAVPSSQPSDADNLPATPAVPEPLPIASHRPQASAATRHAASADKAVQAAPPAATKPEVWCNNQCDADSVISDIMKFLSA